MIARAITDIITTVFRQNGVWGAAAFYFFYYYYEQLYYNNEVQQAFKNVCLNKMLSDGYFDMSVYISGRIRKEEIYARLTAHKSKYAVLYKKAYPKPEDAYSFWVKLFGNQEHNTASPTDEELNHEDSIAIVNWVYRTLRKAEDRITFSKELFSQIEELSEIINDIKFTKGIFYNSAKVDVHFFSSVSDISHFVASSNNESETLFFRGHSDPNYILCPSIMRTEKLRKNENMLYTDLLIECPNDFEKSHTHLEKLVKMQHYGLPTRLLDITRNLLVALFFACDNHKDRLGELILISARQQEIKYPQSDTISILASLPAFSFKMQEEFRLLAERADIDNREFNARAGRLIHEVRLEKPAFQPEINKTDVLSNYIVFATKNNSRIVKQDGAFILCGLSGKNGTLESFRYRINGKKVILLVENKDKILKELRTFSINRATLFPEIECVADYLKSVYS